jgi:hypothetical protein
MFQSQTFGRREVLKIGALSLFAGASAGLSRSTAAAALPSNQQQPAKSCIFLLLQGGPSHLDLWDPKPEATAEVRGPFQTIPTKMEGIRFGELLTGSAAIADKLTVVRSMTHRFSNHIAGTYITLTGSDNQPDQDREAHIDDFPGPGAILNYVQERPGKVPTSVSLPNWLSIPGPSNRMPGQYGGFLGSIHDPFVIEGDPNAETYNPLSLSFASDMTSQRVANRISLLKQLDGAARFLENEMQQRRDQLLEDAYEMVIDGRVRQALDLSKESAKSRDRYGRSKYGQSLLVARRLVEAGVQFVSYNAFNQEWDTHGDLQSRYKQLIPAMDQGFSALVEDLADRGLLDSTLVINSGEFGRTPKMNNGAGRDHWPMAYSTVLAGGGIKQGLVYGQSDNIGGEVIEGRVAPQDILATMWHLLGIQPDANVYDRLHRPHQISNGHVVKALLT